MEFTIFTALMLWLFVQFRFRRREKRLRDRFEEEFEEEFLEKAELEESLDEWRERAEAYPENILRDFLVETAQSNEGRGRERAVALYRQLGFIDEDYEALEVGRPRERLTALKRMLTVATAEDRDALLDAPIERHVSAVVIAEILSRVGEPEDLAEIFSKIQIEARIMEEPLYAVFADLSLETVEAVLRKAWDEVEAVRVRRVLLDVAADRGVETAHDLMDDAAEADDMELRIGACAAGGRLDDDRSFELLADLLEDDRWEVRARAATSLGRRGDERARDPLAEAMRDPEFWVRQNAAEALRGLGEAGVRTLESVRDESDDEFAVDTARQELNRHDFQRREGEQR
ncbi:MAG: HEAT repeat domain-containing protein [Bradymonadaceae bacterium]